MKTQSLLLWAALLGCCFLTAGCGRSQDQEAKQPELVLAADPPEKNQDQPPEPKETPKEDPAKSDPAPKAKNTGGGALGQTIDFLGSQATGNRFCIIADRSQSLTPNSHRQIKKEILRTLRNLHESSQFHVLVFAKVPESMPGEPWLHGGKDVDKIVPWLDSLPRLLGTKGGPPFHQAFALKPRPDVIFFLTDGIIPAKDPERIAAMNKAKPRTVINTILFRASRWPPTTQPAAAWNASPRTMAVRFTSSCGRNRTRLGSRAKSNVSQGCVKGDSMPQKPDQENDDFFLFAAQRFQEGRTMAEVRQLLADQRVPPEEARTIVLNVFAAQKLQEGCKSSEVREWLLAEKDVTPEEARAIVAEVRRAIAHPASAAASGSGAMRSLGITFLILGIGSFILPLMGIQFRLLQLFGEATPFLGAALAVAGAVLLALSFRPSGASSQEPGLED